MNFYTDTTIQGEMWFRGANNVVYPAYQSLSAIFYKYDKLNTNFYYDVQNNQIEKFEVFYDTLFVQTSSGYIFEKYKMENGNVVPFNQIHNYFTNQTLLDIDYWLDENDKKLYWFEFQKIPFTPNYIDISTLSFGFKFYELDLKTGQYQILLSQDVNLYLTKSVDVYYSNGILENPKITYNSDTNLYNASFIIRNDSGEMGLISMNFNVYEVVEINTYIPFGIVQPSNYTPPPSPTPTPTVTPSISLTPSITPSTTPGATPSSTSSPTPTPTPANIPSVKAVFVSFE